MKPVAFVFLVCLFTLVVIDFYGECESRHSKQLVGGLMEERPVTDEVRQMVAKKQDPIVASIRSTQLGATQKGEVTPISYRTQLVNGVNYFIKIRTLLGKKYVYYHVRIYKDFEGNANFLKVEGPMRSNDAISFF